MLLAYGIALQLDGEYATSVRVLGRAIGVDPDYAVAYNSLALTQKRMTQYDKAIHNFDAGTKALARRFVKGLVNTPESPIIKHGHMRGEKWIETAMFGAMYSASVADGIDSIAWPDGEAAEEEERTEQHRGLYYFDETKDKSVIRVFLPNYFNTFRSWLAAEPTFANLIGNMGTVFEAMGMNDEAEKCLFEASLFRPSAET